MSLNRAYSVLTVKQVDDEERVIEGIATTPTPDRMGDIIEPLGAKFKNPLPLLHQHNHREPVGTVKFDKPTKDGIKFTARLPKIAEAGPLKDRVDTAWGEVKAGLVRGVSIGFRPIDYSFMDDGGIRFRETEIVELSLVTIPANAEAVISTIKSIDAPLLAAFGKEPKDSDRPVPPGASGTKSTPTSTAVKALSKPKGDAAMAKKSLKEQIETFEATRQAKAARMEEIMVEAGEKGETLDSELKEEYDTLERELKEVDEHLVRLRRLEQLNKEKAAVVEGTSQDDATKTRGGVPAQPKSAPLPKGTAFTRFAIALARSKGNLLQAHEIAKSWKDTPEVETVLKAAVAAGTTTDPNWAAPLVDYQNMVSEFAEFLRPQTIIGRIPNLRRVPFNIKIPRQTGTSTAHWVGEGHPKPVSKLAFEQITLGHAKLAGIVVLTDELVRFSNPSAEAIVRQDLADTIIQTMDRDFVDPDKAAVSNVSPASITNGVTPINASGTDADALRADVRQLFEAFIAQNMSLAGAVWIMTEVQALAISMMQNPLGQPEFPGLTANGGTFMNLPVIVSENVPGDDTSGASGGRIILVKATEILLADDGVVTLDASREASLEMNDTPTNPVTASTVMVSLWQHNMVGLRAERYINWAKRRAGAVQFITGANYGAA